MSDDDSAGLQRPRPTEQELLQSWTSYFSDPLLSLSSLRDLADAGRLDEVKGLRSLSWRFFFSLLPSPAPLPSTPSGPNSTFSTYNVLLKTSRAGYADLRERYLRAPDGKWVNDGGSGGENDSGAGSAATAGAGKGAKKLEKVDVRMNNPLGLEEDNPWQSWFADLELRKTIRQDVLRTFPEVDYFRLATTQDRLTNLLFIFCKLTPQIGYRQGMHELLAPLLWAVDYDSLPPSSDEESLPHLVLARDWVEHDTWALFSALMKSAQVYYDHTPSVSVSPRPQSAFDRPSSSSSGSASSLVQPIVSIANHLHTLLLNLDPPLHAAFTRLQVEPQLYAIRWLRLLFSREFPYAETLSLWDGLFARDPSLHLTTHIALAMLLRIRDALIAASHDGYGEFLHVLLRYPLCADGSFQTPLLIQQAVYLRDNLSPTAADAVRRQNVELGVAMGPASPGEVDEDVDLRSPTARGLAHRRAASASPSQGLGLFGRGLVGDLAKGVYGRAEALGINKAITGAFNDIKRDFAEAQAQLEEQRRQRTSFSQIPSSSPWDSPAPPPAAKDALSDLAKMRASSLAMSNAIDLCVAVLERGLVPPTPVGSPIAPAAEVVGKDDIPLEGGKSAPVNGEAGRKGAPALGPETMALTALKHIRDVLGGQAQVFDSSVLEPLRRVLDGSPAAAPSIPLPPPTTFASPPLPPLPSAESPAASPAPPLAASPAPPAPSLAAPAPAKAVPPPTNAPTPSSSAATPPAANAPPPPSSHPSLLLGGRSLTPSTGLTRTPQPTARPPDPLLNPSRYPPQRSPVSPAPPPTPSPPPGPSQTPQPQPAAFPPVGFSTRPGPSSSSVGRSAAPQDPLGAL
ncbi:hypothetical protein JCM10207_002694 [Rhodosporidiobolus poonsookiae]